ncbi:hypothetical protein B0T17DRAFT_514320 [Bombardia bombarda]|uniref:BSD domain-containing protein n=1 Tax=Bombardia bombarda TaxID=252184 RepID=A0AA40CDG9_9PEZI|nr:hypothetical protein B0T17DRAFT_514320 [Bombardia bombarda]
MSMDIPRGTAAYKKKDGIITLTDDRLSLIWTPLPGDGPPVVSLLVGNITNLQQTPDSAAKVMLKVFEKPRTEGGDPATYLFHFTSPTDARSEANAVKDILSTLLAEIRANDPTLPKPVAAEKVAAAANGNDPAASSAALSFASAANAKPQPIRWFDDAMLKVDTELQQSLLMKDASLNETYTDARSTKPESISDAAFNAQFWATRVGLLRAHAIQLNQRKGAYHVLSTINPRLDDGNLKLNLVTEQVQMIFDQHPIVKRIYNENVPKLGEAEFWSRFFLSRLHKKLRGERITDVDSTDPLFDKYNETDNFAGFASRIKAQQVPHIIDLEANEENQGGFKSGNKKDVEMRPRYNVPIVKTLNSLSEKIMANVAPTDQDPAAPNGLDDDTYKEQLALRDLRGETEASRFVLNVKEQTSFFSAQNSAQSEEAKIYQKQIPSEVLFEIQADMETLDDDGAGGIDLHQGIGVDEDSDSDRDMMDEKHHAGGTQKFAHVGSRAARKQAQVQILDGMRKKRHETYGLGGGADADVAPMSIPAELAQRCYITNATTTEFLKQFWAAFISADPARAQELAYHADSLGRSVDRIDALAAEAERLRIAAMEKRKRQIKELYQKTGKKAKWVNIGGGKDAVMALFEATLTSLSVAQSVYNSGQGSK